jgi:hypothetical protein
VQAHFGVGYNVVMEKRNGADEKALQQYVLSHIPVTTPTLPVISRRFIHPQQLSLAPVLRHSVPHIHLVCCL